MIGYSIFLPKLEIMLNLDSLKTRTVAQNGKYLPTEAIQVGQWISRKNKMVYSVY